ncbi:MAG: hypothetical protein ACJA09_001107 [Alcanivorax sp.]|jgi:hypothetical protein
MARKYRRGQQSAPMADIYCLLTGAFFAPRNYLIGHNAGSNERGIMAFIAKMLGRNID